MTKLEQLTVGEKFTYRDKFNDFWVRDYKGEVIGQTSRDWTAVELTSKKHHNTETGEVKFNYKSIRFVLMDSRILVSKQPPESEG